MASCMVRVEIEVEVMYTCEGTIDDYTIEMTETIVHTDVPSEVRGWAEEEAMKQFERNPSKAIKEG